MFALTAKAAGENFLTPNSPTNSQSQKKLSQASALSKRRDLFEKMGLNGRL
jgi:hypothetical protein